MAAKLSITLEEDEENGLKSRHEMCIAMVVYVVFQLSLLGSLLSSSHFHFHSACNTPHFYLSIAASLFTIITLLFAYVAEDMQEVASSHNMAAPPCYKKEDMKKTALPCSASHNIAVLPCYKREDMQKTAPPCYWRRVVACFHVALYPLLVYALISMR